MRDEKTAADVATATTTSKKRGRPPDLDTFEEHAHAFRVWRQLGSHGVPPCGKQWANSTATRWNELTQDQRDIIHKVFGSTSEEEFRSAFSKKKRGQEPPSLSKQAAVCPPSPLSEHDDQVPAAVVHHAVVRDAVGRVIVQDGLKRMKPFVPVPTIDASLTASWLLEHPVASECESACASACESDEWKAALKDLKAVTRKTQADFAPMFQILLQHGFPKGNAKRVVRQGLPKEFTDLWIAAGHDVTMLSPFMHRQAKSGV